MASRISDLALAYPLRVSHVKCGLLPENWLSSADIPISTYSII
jgi:hypothetical protein